MADPATDDSAREITIRLMRYYSFDLDGFTAEYRVEQWLAQYPAQWLQPAVVEALYQGRYKAISVEQILTLWQRRDRTLYHFNGEFERIVCSQFSAIGAPETVPKSDLPEPIPSYALKPQPEAKTNPPTVQAVDSSASKVATGFDDITAFLRKPRTVVPDREASHRDAQLLPFRHQRGEQAHDEFSDELDTVLPFEARGSASDSGDRPIVSTSSDAGEPPIPPFKPTDGQVTNTAELLRLTDATPSSNQAPIHQFVPTTRTNHFYSKLKAVIQRHDHLPDDSGDVVSSLVLTRNANEKTQ